MGWARLDPLVHVALLAMRAAFSRAYAFVVFLLHVRVFVLCTLSFLMLSSCCLLLVFCSCISAPPFASSSAPLFGWVVCFVPFGVFLWFVLLLVMVSLFLLDGVAVWGIRLLEVMCLHVLASISLQDTCVG